MAQYPVGLVGERNYQSAIRSSAVGERVQFRHEPENPHDPRAVVALNRSGAVLGYLPRGGWLTSLIIDQGKAPTACIKAINGGGRGDMLGVVLAVGTANEDLTELGPKGSANLPKNGRANALSSFVRGLLKGLSK